jgi:hypothetical protein
MRLRCRIALLGLCSSATSARAEASAPAARSVRPRKLWLEPALSLGPYHAPPRHTPTDDPGPDEQYGIAK